jgi:hypothetical protein
MGRLGEADRNAIVLRFFENKTDREAGAALKIPEATARKRVNRALEKLRKIFTKRGVSLPAALIASAVAASSVQAAPAGLAATVAAAAAKGTTISTAITMLVKGTMKTMTWLKYKFAAGVCLAALLIGGAATVAISQTSDGGKQTAPPAPPPKLATKGFAGILEVHSVSFSDTKIVFVVSGPCELLLGKMPVGSGEAQQVSAAADHTVVVWHRIGLFFPTAEAWRAECEQVKALTGKGIYLATAGENLTWRSGDLTMVETDNLRVFKWPAGKQ